MCFSRRRARLPWMRNYRYRRLLGVVLMADGFALGPPSSWQPSTSTLQSFCYQPDLVLRGIYELPPLVMYTSTDLIYSPIATDTTELGVSTSSSISLRWRFPPLERKLQCWPSLTLTFFRLPSLSTASLRYRHLLSPFDPAFASLQSVLNKT